MQIMITWLRRVAFLILPSVAWSQEYTFSRLSITDGLASNFVYSVWQDPKGFLWVGSESGLQRYDGRKFVSFYDHHIPNFLPSLPVQQILSDYRGNMWVRMNKRVGVFNSSSMEYHEAAIKTASPVPNNANHVLWKDNKGNIYLLIPGHTSLTYNEKGHCFEEGPLPYVLPPGWKQNLVHQDRQTGNFWIATDSGLVVYDLHRKSWYSRNRLSPEYPVLDRLSDLRYINNFFIDNQRKFWVAYWDFSVKNGGQRLVCFDEKAGRTTADTTGFQFSSRSYKELHQVHSLSDSSVWAYGLNLLVRHGPHDNKLMGFESLVEDFGIRFSYVFQVIEDHEKVLWLATDNGLYSSAPDPQCSMHVILAKHKAPATITSILERPDGDIWLGTWGRGILGIYDSITPQGIYRNMPSNGEFKMVWDIRQHSRTGHVWAGCQSGKLVVYDTVRRHSVFLSPPAFRNRTVRKMAEDLQGNIWFGTQGGQLVRYKAGAALVPASFELIGDFETAIFKLYTDKNGRLWIGTFGKGLYVYDPISNKTVAHYDNQGQPGKLLSENSITDITQLNDSIMAIGSGQLNLLNLRTGVIRILTMYDGLPGNSITSLQADRFGQLWISTKSGLCRYNPRKQVFTRYDQRDGLITTTSNESLMNVSLSQDNGHLIFAGNQHAVFFDPACYISKSSPPDVRITDFKLFNEYLPPDSILKLDKIRLDDAENSITIAFASLSFRQRDKLIYYYMLEGADKGWQRADSRLIASYTLLPPGGYTFKVRSENEEGTPSAGITTLQIYIKPPFWRTWWFLLLVLAALGALGYLIHRLRVNRLMAVEKVRRRVARDLHDDMGSTLSTINILSEMARMKIDSDTSASKAYIEKISDNSTRMMEAMDDIVWSINPMNDNMQKITARMREFAATVLEPKGIEYSFVVDENVKDLVLDMEARRDFFLVFKEAVNNLAKYSRASNALIRLQVISGKLKMEIRDDGIGFEAESADNGNGLTNMRKRSEMMKGLLRIISARNAGTRITLEIPVT